MKCPLVLALALGAAACSAPATPGAKAPMPVSESTSTLSAGDAAPGFSLASTDGSEVSLSSLIASGPAVLVFYRGDW